MPLDFFTARRFIRRLDFFAGPTSDQLLVDLFLDLFLAFHGVTEIL